MSAVPLSSSYYFNFKINNCGFQPHSLFSVPIFSFFVDRFGFQQVRIVDFVPSIRGIHLGFVAGVITRERLPAFEKMLWRACRGNVFLRQAEIEDQLEDPQMGGTVRKSVFLLFFQVSEIALSCY